MADDTIPRQADDFYGGAYARIVRTMFVLGGVLALLVFLAFGPVVGIGFMVGCGIAMLNFHWLKRVVSALADRTTGTGRKQSGGGVVARFLLRYLLVAGVAYAIFRVSLTSVYGLLAGLFLPVAAIMVEAVYEVYVALRQGV